MQAKPFQYFWSTGLTGAGASEAAALNFSAVLVSLARNDAYSLIVLMSGAGNTTVVFLSTPDSTRVCRFRNCNANGCAIIVSDASARAAAARTHPPRRWSSRQDQVCVDVTRLRG